MPIVVLPNLTIPDEDLKFETGTASGPGGQNVNKVETRVTLLFDLEHSASVTASQRARLHEQLSTRISKDGILRVVSQKERSQSGNRRLVVERFIEILREALFVERKRRPTRATRGSVRRRLEQKKQRSDIKKGRSRRYGRDA
ncbi:MAG: alternative ribosome rescue aminoacyl-tRNA hydrolase ArfB [Planctomycetota bacterium]